jgi:hypothetical protein
MMKTWLITLPLLCATGVAMAQGAEKQAAADQPAAVGAPAEPAAAPAQAGATPEAKAPVKAAAPAKARPKHRIGKRAHKALPTGDMRYCLDRKSDAEIIRCSETRRKK